MSSEQEIKEFLKKKDFYDIMGVSKQCTEAELKKAYRKLALLYHPDKNDLPGAQEAFKKIASAYDCLSNPEKRRVYDQYGNEEPELHQRHYNQQFHQNASADDIFRAFFGQDGGFEDMFSGFRSFNNGAFVYTSGSDNRRRAQQPRGRQHFPEQRQGSTMGSWCMYLVLIYIFFGSTIINGLKYIFEEKPYTQFLYDSVYNHSLETPLIKLSFFARKEYLDLDQFRKIAHEQELEREYLHNLDQECRLNRNTYDNLIMQSRSAWLQSTRDQYIKRANQVDQSACRTLKNFKDDIPNLRQIYGI